MKKILISIALGFVALLCLVALFACGGEANQDAQQGDRNTGPADVINMPDGFSNVASKCDGPNRVYTINHKSIDGVSKEYGAVAVVANDPRCTGPTAK